MRRGCQMLPVSLVCYDIFLSELKVIAGRKFGGANLIEDSLSLIVVWKITLIMLIQVLIKIETAIGLSQFPDSHTKLDRY